MPKINTAYTFDVALVSQADTKLFQVNPTLAAGDVKISGDEGAFANLTNLPVVTPAGGRTVKVILTAAEMNANRVAVQFVDVAGAEWCDLILDLETSPDDLTVSNIVDANWDEARSGHVAAGTYGEGVASVQGAVASVTAGVALTAGERTSVADVLLNRDLSAVTVTNDRSPINALRFNRNKYTIVGTTLTVYKEDDTTIAWTATISGVLANQDLGADPT